MPGIHIDVLARLDEASAEDVSRNLERHFERTGENIGGVLGNAIRRRLEQADVGEGLIRNFEHLQQQAEKAGAAIGASLVGGISAAAIGLEKIGDTFENIHRQLALTTDASGAAFDNLNSRANALVGTLDTAANNVGRDFGLMASRVRDTGPELEKLVGHVEMLRDRFQGLDVNALASEFAQFGVVGAAKADEALASLTQSAISANVSLAQLVATIGPEAATFRQAGFNIEQAGAAIAALERDGVPAQKAVSGLEVAMKAMDDAIKNGRGNWPSFQAFMQDVSVSVNNLLNAGRIGDAQRLMEEVTGQRRWAEAMPLIQRFNEILANPDGYRAQAGYLDDLQKKTANLHNEWQKLKNQMILTLEPIAAEWIETLIGKLHDFGDWAKAHQEDLKNMFKGAAEIAGGVITVLEKITELLGQHPALIQAVVVAFAAWETISGVASLIRDLNTVISVLRAMPAAAAEAGAGITAGLAGAAAGILGVQMLMDKMDRDAAAKAAKGAAGPPEAPSKLAFVPGLPGGTVGPQGGLGQVTVPGLGTVNVPSPGQPGQQATLAPGWEAFGTPAEGGGLPGLPGAPAPAAPGAPGAPEAPPGYGGLEPGFEDKLKGARGSRGPRLPEAPEVPYGPGYGVPEIGETATHFKDRMELLEKQHELATDQARLDQLQKDSNANQTDIQKVKNKIVQDQLAITEAEAKVNKSETERLKKHSEDLGEIGAKIDKDFGISKGLSGIAENLFKFLANLAAAPLEGVLGAVSQAGGAAKGEGLAGLALGAMGITSGKGVPAAGAAGVGQPVWTGSGWTTPAARGTGGGEQMPGSFDITGAMNSPGDIMAGGARVKTLYALANVLTGTPYSMPLRNDCSGMVSKLVTAALGMSPQVAFDTTSEGAFLFSHGFQQGVGPPGSLQVGWRPLPGSAGHTAITLPGGEGAETGLGPGGSFGLGPGGPGRGALEGGFSQHAWLPMDSGGAVGGGKDIFSQAGSAIASGAQSLWQAFNSPAAGAPPGTKMDQYGELQPTVDAPKQSLGQQWNQLWQLPSRGSGGEVPIIAHSGEHVLTAADVDAMGGQAGVYAFRNALHYDVGGPPEAPPGWPPAPPAPAPPQDVKIAGPLPAAPPGPPGATPHLPAGTPAAPGPAQPSPVGGLAPWAGDPKGGQAGISQGGLLGGAINAGIQAAMGSGGMSFGAGAAAGVAAQIAMQEINRAIAAGGQYLGIGLQAIGQTFKLSDSQLAQSGWGTRIAGGLAGAAPVLANMAGQLGGSGQGTGLPQGVAGLPGAPGGLTPEGAAANLTSTGAPGTPQSVHNGNVFHNMTFNYNGPPEGVGPTMDSLGNEDQVKNMGAGDRGFGGS